MVAFVDNGNYDSWSLVGHGGQHAVFSYNGPCNEVLSGTVVRARVTFLDSIDDIKLLELEKAVAEYVFSRYLDEKYAIHQIVIKISDRLLNIFKLLLKPVEKFQNCKIFSHGLLCKNIFTLSSNVFEIKPKWHGCNDAPEFHCIAKCPYCSHKKRISDKSRYCPTLLFSDQKDHISKALEHYPFKQNIGREYIKIASEIMFHDRLLTLLKYVHRFNCHLAGKLNDLGCKMDTTMYLELLSSHLNGSVYSQVAEFLITFSVKDCSFFIVIDDVFNESHRSIEIDGKMVSYALFVIDIDVKPISRLEEYLAKIRNFCHHPE